MCYITLCIVTTNQFEVPRYITANQFPLRVCIGINQYDYNVSEFRAVPKPLIRKRPNQRVYRVQFLIKFILEFDKYYLEKKHVYIEIFTVLKCSDLLSIYRNIPKMSLEPPVK